MAMQKENGLVLSAQVQPGRRLLEQAVKLLLAESLYAGIAGSLLDMAGLGRLAVLLLPGAMVLALQWLLWRLPVRLRWLTAVLGAAVLLVPFVNPESFLDGAKTFLNALFSASEQQQPYLYEHFTVSGSEGGLVWFLAVAAAAAAFLCGAVMESRITGVSAVLVLPLLVFGVQIYLGVFPEGGWTLLLFTAAAVSAGYHLSGRGGKTVSCMVLAALVLLASAVTAAVYPGESQILSAWSSSVRDYLDEHIAPEASGGETAGEESSRPQEEQKATEETEDGTDVQKEAEGFLGAHIGTIRQLQPWVAGYLLAVAGVLLLLAACRLGVRAWKSKRRRKGFDTLEPSGAVREMFLYLTELLRVLGLEPRNAGYADYCGEVGALSSEKGAEGYRSAVLLWQEAEYSGHRMGEAQRMAMRTALDRVVQEAYSRQRRKGKYRMKWFEWFGRRGGRDDKKKAV